MDEKLGSIALDDRGKSRERTRAVMKDLADTRQRLRLHRQRRHPTAEVAVPFTREKRMLSSALATGAGLLRRESADRYVFNFRASYAEETRTSEWEMVEVRRILHEEIFAVFAPTPPQQDGYGDAGLQTAWARLRRKYKRNPTGRWAWGYRVTQRRRRRRRDPAQSRHPVRAVVMVATYRRQREIHRESEGRAPRHGLQQRVIRGEPGARGRAIGTAARWGRRDRHPGVPLPHSKSTAVLKLQEMLPKYSAGRGSRTFVSLEGYLAASLLIEGLKRRRARLHHRVAVTRRGCAGSHWALARRCVGERAPGVAQGWGNHADASVQLPDARDG